jgi:uncharacterized membrane protein
MIEQPSIKQRIQSIDLVRGAIMLIMALDHTRLFLHIHAVDDEPTNLLTTSPALFFTRWITHFCAPGFLFLSGVSAFLSGRSKTPKELSQFLIKRGIWLLGIELLVVTFSWSFDPSYSVFFLQVIWAIGWSMILLGLLVRTSLAFVLLVGCLVFFGHNLLDYLNLPKQGAGYVALSFLLTTNKIFFNVGGKHLFDIYAILPWTAIMLLGYSCGRLFLPSQDNRGRRRKLLNLGFGLTLAFIALRWINRYGDPEPWSTQKSPLFTFLSFLNTTKYPVSLLYSCMTLGPILILLSLLEGLRGRLAGLISVFGRVPFFFYVIHFYLIHLICMAVFFAKGNSWNQIHDPQSPFLFRPSHFGIGLLGVYGIWILVILILYFPCRNYDAYKKIHRTWWLSYV